MMRVSHATICRCAHEPRGDDGPCRGGGPRGRGAGAPLTLTLTTISKRGWRQTRFWEGRIGRAVVRVGKRDPDDGRCRRVLPSRKGNDAGNEKSSPASGGERRRVARPEGRLPRAVTKGDESAAADPRTRWTMDVANTVSGKRGRAEVDYRK